VAKPIKPIKPKAEKGKKKSPRKRLIDALNPKKKK
jgi:hypothetical protein